jgi:hypothetical protein
MKLIKLSIFIPVLLICSFSGLAGSDKQEVQKSIYDTFKSVDDTALQLALKTKYLDKGPIQIGRDTLVFLSGIDNVQVMLPQLQEYGLTEGAVKTRIELRLRRNGIKVYDVPVDPNDDWIAFYRSHPDIGYFSTANLALTITIVSLSQRDIVAANVTLSQSQIASLLSADKPTFFLATTWSSGQLVIGSSQNIAQVCREAIDELVDMYCNDYLAANPKESLHQNNKTKTD